LAFAAVTASIPIDSWIKSTGSGHANSTALGRLPLLPEVASSKVCTLALNCLTTHYAELWRSVGTRRFGQEAWLGDDRVGRRVLAQAHAGVDAPLRVAHGLRRRWALVELTCWLLAPSASRWRNCKPSTASSSR
jgi:hypothetical protein